MGDARRPDAPGELDPGARAHLLAVARASIARSLGLGGVPPLDPSSPDCHGVFVSLHGRDGRLRGCVGCFEGRGSLDETVASMAVESASRDPRFPAVRPGELDGLVVELSVLGPVVPITDASSIEVGRHGVVVRKGIHRGVLLPQVASEHGWDRATFLGQVCAKAGLAATAWLDPGAGISVFTAEVFAEPPGPAPP